MAVRGRNGASRATRIRKMPRFAARLYVKLKACSESGEITGHRCISQAEKVLMFRQERSIVTMITALVRRRLHHGNTDMGVNRIALACDGMRVCV
jgi:hypothetical protein